MSVGSCISTFLSFKHITSCDQPCSEQISLLNFGTFCWWIDVIFPILKIARGLKFPFGLKSWGHGPFLGGYKKRNKRSFEILWDFCFYFSIYRVKQFGWK